jgi:replicative DNA helicase
MNIDNGLITKVVETGNYQLAVNARLTSKLFSGSSKAIWDFILDHAREYRQAPSAEALGRKFGDWRPEETNEPLQYFIDQIKERARYNMILDALNNGIAKAMEARDANGAQKVLFELASKLNTEVNVSDDINLADFVEELMAIYEHREKHLGVDGIAFPWDLANDATGGMHGKELITIAAKSGVGKTWFEIVLMVFMAMQGYKCLFISKEMDAPPLATRTVATGLKFPYQELRTGRLGEFGKKAYFDKLVDDTERLWMQNIVISADASAGDTLLAIRTKIEEHNPDIIIIDGAYLIEGEGESEWVKTKTITRGLKQMTRVLNKPIAISNQLNRTVKKGKKADQDNLAYGASFYNDSDVVIFLYQSEEQAEVKKMVVHFDKVREGKGPTLLLNWDFDAMDFSMAGDMSGMAIDGEDDDDVLNYA